MSSKAGSVNIGVWLDIDYTCVLAIYIFTTVMVMFHVKDFLIVFTKLMEISTCLTMPHTQVLFMAFIFGCLSSRCLFLLTKLKKALLFGSQLEYEECLNLLSGIRRT